MQCRRLHARQKLQRNLCGKAAGQRRPGTRATRLTCSPWKARATSCGLTCCNLSMKQHPKRRMRVAISLAVLLPFTASAQEPSPPKIDHILLEVADLKKSIAFYHDFLGLDISSQTKVFAIMQSV